MKKNVQSVYFFERMIQLDWRTEIYPASSNHRDYPQCCDLAILYVDQSLLSAVEGDWLFGAISADGLPWCSKAYAYREPLELGSR